MVELIDVTKDAMEPMIRIPCWRVSVSRRVWNQCVEQPGKGRGDRLWNLTYQLWDALKVAPLSSPGVIATIGGTCHIPSADARCNGRRCIDSLSNIGPEHRSRSRVWRTLVQCIKTITLFALDFLKI